MPVRERTLAGRYRLEEVIGRGGMSTVYRATDEVLGRTVAVKVLLAPLAEQDPTFATRFRREARAAAALASSAVVTVYDTGADEDGDQFIVMEYIRGRSLAEVLGDGHPLAVAEALRIAQRVADALLAAHSAGVLHRDIKPANVMVAQDGTVKVLDFGIARRLDGTTLTQAASVIGTAAYMAPERALGRPGDARSDIYSLGCLLYAMLTGRPPFTGEVAAALLHQQVEGDPEAPGKLRAEVPAAVDALVMAMLAKAPEDRPQTAGEVRDQLLSLSGVPRDLNAAGAAVAAAVAAQPTAATAVLPSSPRTAPTMVAAAASVLADRRARALAMGLAAALVALLAIVLLAGGGSSPRRASSGARAVTHPVQTVAPPVTTPTNTTPAGPKPPGHGGKSPGHDKHHGQGGQGGDGGGD